MKIAGIYAEAVFGKPRFTITFQEGQNEVFSEFVDNLGAIDPDADYEVLIRKKKKKRSLDANSYFWTLLGQLATKLHAKKIDLYKSYIRDTGAFEIVPVRVDALDKWREMWECRGDGWIVEDMGRCKNYKNFHNVRCYYGTSQYTTEEMAHIIDLVAADCKEQGIETMTADEIERLKATWK